MTYCQDKEQHDRSNEALREELAHSNKKLADALLQIDDLKKSWLNALEGWGASTKYANALEEQLTEKDRLNDELKAALRMAHERIHSDVCEGTCVLECKESRKGYNDPAPEEKWKCVEAGPSDVDPMERTTPVTHNAKLCPRCKQMDEERKNFGPGDNYLG